MKRTDCDVVIVGAGVAGLAAAAALKQPGKDVQCLEATDRIGGRILTIHDPLSPTAIELGAEFVHGRPPEIWERIRSANLTVYEHASQAIHVERGRRLDETQIGSIAERVFAKMGRSSRQKDESFEDYLRRSSEPSDSKDWAGQYIEGFNAARKEQISVASLLQDAEAADKIDGDRAFRIPAGYDSIPNALLRSIPAHESIIHLNSLVERVHWRRGSVAVHYKSRLDNQPAVMRCRQLIVTVPLGVLQATAPGPGVIQFDPVPIRIIRAAGALRFGHVFRLIFRFQNAFWEEEEKFKGLGFVLSREKRFFTWWTMHPVFSPVLVGWMAGSAAEQYRASDLSRIAGDALRSLARMLGRDIPRPEAFYFHNWRNDPFFRGAYSYVPVNGLSARMALAKPVDNTLFFAGEATELNGHSATVHGAIASGLRAASLAADGGF